MAAESDKARRLKDDINVLQRSIIQKEAELQGVVEGSMESQPALADASEVTRRLDHSLRENMDLHRRWGIVQDIVLYMYMYYNNQQFFS